MSRRIKSNTSIQAAIKMAAAEYQVPPRSIRLVLKSGRRVRGDTTLKHLREVWEGLPIEAAPKTQTRRYSGKAMVSLLARTIAARLSLPKEAVSLVNRYGDEYQDPCNVRYLREDWVDKRSLANRRKTLVQPTAPTMKVRRVVLRVK